LADDRTAHAEFEGRGSMGGLQGRRPGTFGSGVDALVGRGSRVRLRAVPAAQQGSGIFRPGKRVERVRGGGRCVGEAEGCWAGRTRVTPANRQQANRQAPKTPDRSAFLPPPADLPKWPRPKAARFKGPARNPPPITTRPFGTHKKTTLLHIRKSIAIRNTAEPRNTSATAKPCRRDETRTGRCRASLRPHAYAKFSPEVMSFHAHTPPGCYESRVRPRARIGQVGLCKEGDGEEHAWVNWRGRGGGCSWREG